MKKHEFEPWVCNPNECAVVMGRDNGYPIPCGFPASAGVHMPDNLPVPEKIAQEGKERPLTHTEVVTCVNCRDYGLNSDGEPMVKLCPLHSLTEEMKEALEKIYAEEDDACGCECDNENCCVVVGEPCSKCTARAVLARLGDR